MTTMCKPGTAYKRSAAPIYQRPIDPRITDDIAPWAQVQSLAVAQQPGIWKLGVAWPSTISMPHLSSNSRELELNASHLGNPLALQNLPTRLAGTTTATAGLRTHPWNAQGRLSLSNSLYPSPPVSHFEGWTATLQADSQRDGNARSREAGVEHSTAASSTPQQDASPTFLGESLELSSTICDLIQVSTLSTSSSKPITSGGKRARELEHESTDRASKKRSPVMLKFFVPARTRARRVTATRSADHAIKTRFRVPKGMRAKAEELDPDHVIITWLRQVAGAR